MSLTVEKCLQAWTNSLRQMNAKADVVFFGDSLTYYGEFSSIFPDKVVCNLGLRGDTIQGMINRLSQIQLLNPKLIFLMAGINDVTSCTPGKFKEQFENLVVRIQGIIPSAVIVIQSLLPVNDKDYTIHCNNNLVRACNIEIKKVADMYHLCFLDLFSMYENEKVLHKNDTIDGIHLTQQAYNRWLEIIRNIHF